MKTSAVETRVTTRAVVREQETQVLPERSPSGGLQNGPAVAAGAPGVADGRGGGMSAQAGPWYHGGFPGLKPGDVLKPSPPHVTDGCPICVARAAGRAITVGEYRRWLMRHGEAALPALKALGGAADDEIMDAPSEEAAVYITTDVRYATWYAARSGHGDVYEVRPCGEVVISTEDHFESATVATAEVVRVVRRRVWLTRSERRELDRAWRKADAAQLRATGHVAGARSA